jgi:hypothetical protein
MYATTQLRETIVTTLRMWSHAMCVKKIMTTQ